MSKTFKIMNLGDTAEVFLYGVVGGWDNPASDFVREIDSLDVENIRLRVNSPGGDVFEGIAMMNALAAHPATVTGVVEGLAASAASVVLAGGCDRVIMRPAAEIMIHDAWSTADGNAAELVKHAEKLEQVSESLAHIYADRVGGNADDWREMMRNETWFTADEAVQVGLADVIEAGREQPVERIAASADRFKYSGRDSAPVPLVLMNKQKEEKNMSVFERFFAALGVDTKNDVVMSKLEELVSEAVDAPADSPADVPEPEVVEEEQEVQEESTPVAEPEDVQEEDQEDTTPNLDDLTVTIDKTTYEELKANAAYGMKARENDIAQARIAKVDAAIRENRISNAAREQWIKAMAADELGATERLQRIPVDTIPRVELGHGLEHEQIQARSIRAPFTSVTI